MFVGKPEGKGTRGRLRPRGEDNTGKMGMILVRFRIGRIGGHFRRIWAVINFGYLYNSYSTLSTTV
jgi:hypothetical protein